MSRASEERADREALKQAMNALMERVREDAQAQERLMAHDPQVGERAAKLRIVLNEARKRLENITKSTAQSTDNKSAAP
ncbi:MAG: hypothetical protein K0M67_12610 [Thiobacillus sp.]|nr:hypothetical protein [Thiobacillus sp.]